MESGNFECEVENGVVWVRFRGLITADLADAMLEAVMRTGTENGCYRFLYDIRGASLGETMLDLYGRPGQAEMLGLKISSRHAMLCSEANDKAEFLETVTTNRGFEFRVFTDEAASLAWLNA